MEFLEKESPLARAVAEPVPAAERLNKEVKRRADVVGIFANEAPSMRLTGAVRSEKNDEWQTSSRCMMVEAFAQIDKEKSDRILSITTKAA